MTEHNYGVVYRPCPNGATPFTSIRELKKRGVGYVRLQWVDLANVTKYRVLSLCYFEKLLQSPRPGIGIPTAVAVAPSSRHLTECLYIADLSSLRICPYAPGHVSVMGWLQHKSPTKQVNGIVSLGCEICPRALLKRIVSQAKYESGVEFLVGFETEFILLKSTDPVEASNYHRSSAAEALKSGCPEATVMHEIAEAIQASGIELQLYHAERAPGQYEVVTGPLAPLEAADALVHTREIIRNVASTHGLHATFAPRVFSDAPGSSAHTHISVHSSHEGKKEAQAMTTTETAFLAGLLEHLPALTALALPTPPSYGRMVDGIRAGGTYVCWGADTREAPVRLKDPCSPTSRRFEVRTIDGTANPYIALAGVLCAGHAGVQSQQRLTCGDMGPSGAAEMGEEARLKLGITQRLPLTWEEARSAFEKDDLFLEVFGKGFIDEYLAANKEIGNMFLSVDGNEKALSQLVEFY
ncbi:hypothetical protein AX17_002978 [Amanita inopinata Kibby_2008]|nr:hypothetical protein AX17_002978 [Amanita inopinata Kibby_2008]